MERVNRKKIALYIGIVACFCLLLGPVPSDEAIAGGTTVLEKSVDVGDGMGFVDADDCNEYSPTATGLVNYQYFLKNGTGVTWKIGLWRDDDLGILVPFPGIFPNGFSVTVPNEVDKGFDNLIDQDVCKDGDLFFNNKVIVTACKEVPCDPSDPYKPPPLCKGKTGDELELCLALECEKKPDFKFWDTACVKCEEPKLCSIGNFVFEDANRDGCQGEDERGIAGVPVTLIEYSTTDCTGSTVTKSTTTGSDGFYGFTGLDCNKSYIVEFGDAGEIYARTTQDSNVCDDKLDSDCAVGDGKTGCYTFPDPVNNPNNPTIDCGYVCEGKIGDFVWTDSNGTPGCQDPDEPGIKDIIVNLFQVDGCPDDPGPDPFKTTETNDQGKYLFEGLCPGDYRVKFVDPEGRDNTIVNQSCENFPPGPPPGTTDSDCGGPGECVTLTVGSPVDETIDCGKIPPECALAVDKKCQVEPPATGPFECKDKIDALKMIWNGPGTLQSVEALPGGNDSFPKVEITVENGDQVVTVTDYQPSSNDVIWNWVSSDGSGQSEFHLSCSDDEMDGPEDCGKPQGNGKSNDDNFANVWLLDGLATDKGFVFDCTPQPAVPSDDCEFEASPVPGCKTDPEVNDLTSITFRYTGADCSASDNDQGPIGDKWDCEGVPGADPVSITVIKDAGKTSTDKASVNVGDIFTLGNDFSSESILTVGGQTLTFHTSCSQPLAVGDVFGSLVVVGINGLSPGANVTYFYTVTNVGGTDAEVTSVFDDQLGQLLGNSRGLTPNQSFTLEETALISKTTTNTVTVQGNVAGTIFECSGASDTVTVTVKEPTCEVSIQLDKIEDRKIKWKLSNPSSIPATIETLTITWPGSTKLKKVKYDGSDILKDVLLTSPATITSDEWLKETKDRTVKAGDSGKNLELEFDVNFPLKNKQPPSDFDLTVTFEQGCEVSF